MKIVMLGQGAIGTLWASQLANIEQVSLSVYSTSPLTSTERSNDINTAFSHFNGQSEQLTFTKATEQHLLAAEVLFVCVKAPHVVHTITPLLKQLPDSIAIILCHNGMGTLDELMPLLPAASSVLTMITTHGAFRPTQKHTIHTGLGKTDLGVVKGAWSQSQNKQLTALLNKALPQVNWQEQIIEKQWLKLAINCVINPITAIHNVANGEVIKPKFKRLVSALSDEISQVASSQRVVICSEEIIKQVSVVANNTAQNRSSMLCDISQQQATEINYINGYLLKLAAKANICVPENEALVAQVKLLESNGC